MSLFLLKSILFFASFSSFGSNPNLPQSPTSPPPSGAFCPPGSSWDLANCHFGPPPAGKLATLYLTSSQAAFCTNANQAQCVSPYSWRATFSPPSCFKQFVPSGYFAFVYNNNWYTGFNRHLKFQAFNPTDINSFASISNLRPTIAPQWHVKKYINSPDSELRPVCLNTVVNPDSPRSRTLIWSDEFGNQPDNKTCYTSNDRLRLTTDPDWGNNTAVDNPPTWRPTQISSWNSSQLSRYQGLFNLDKCTWNVYDTYNKWDSSISTANLNSRIGGFSPKGIVIQNGILSMKTWYNPKQIQSSDTQRLQAQYNCGQPFTPPGSHEQYTNDCPYYGQMITTSRSYPWFNSNSPTNTNAENRYTGKSFGLNDANKTARVEFRAKMVGPIGHATWSQLWLYFDHAEQKQVMTVPINDSVKPSPLPVHPAELDVVEFLADFSGTSDQILNKTATYGMAWQTGHDYSVPGGGSIDTTQGIGLPIATGEWHTYAVEWGTQEVRFYIDDCLRNTVREGQMIKQGDGTFKAYHVPTDQELHILIGNPVASANWLPAWYRPYGGGASQPIANFIENELQVDYVRYYSIQDASISPVPTVR